MQTLTTIIAVVALIIALVAFFQSWRNRKGG
jgi:uncharacterized protein involved in outer membrane biogenesis